MKIGVLAAQGAFIEHINMLHRLSVDASAVRLPGELEKLDGLIIPGGESTAISRLIREYNLVSAIKKLAKTGLPIFGTCAGMILLAKEIGDRDNQVEALRLIDIKVKRNAFGRQRDSFETEISIPVLGKKPFHAVFIRAPLIEQAGSGVEVLATLANGTTVAARQEKLLVAAFHPELTDDVRFHQYFLDIVSGHQ